VAPHAALHNLYGPTECAVDVSWWACPPSATPPAVVPIGAPIANTRLYVLDARGELAPIGVPGELHIGGVQVGLGYHNRSELTAERFVRDRYAPAEDGPDARMYRTGDLARWRTDGTVEYLGRLDFQVKIRGFRIELGEIETVLLSHPSVRDCVVDARTDVDGERRLVAYLVATSEAPAASVLRAFLLETLPEHMVPSAFVVLDALPLSSNGKVDRRALPDPRLDRAARSREHVAPRSAAERALAEIWSRVLRVERVGVTDDFFELGGDSLLSIQIVAQAARAGLRLTLTQVLQQPTIAGQASVATATRDERVAFAPSVAAVGEVSLTPVQRWFAELDTPDAQHWNQAFLFTVPASMEHERLRAAVAAVASHHDALRLRFRREARGAWRQWYASDAARSIAVARVDLSGVADADVAAAIAERSDVAQRSLDLEHGPIGCAVHYELGASREGRLLLVLHHFVVDGVSWRVLREDLESAYEQLGGSGEVRFPPSTSSFAAWSAVLGAVAAAGALNDEIEHWTQAVAPDASQVRIPRGELVEIPRLASLARDHSALARDDRLQFDSSEPRGQTPVGSDPSAGPSDANVEGNVRVVELALSVAETRDLLTRVPAAYGTRVDDALVAALGAALGEWLGAGSIVVDLEGHGREEIGGGVDVSRTVGWFTSVFPVRLTLAAGQSPRTRLLETKEMLRRVPRRGVGYGILRYLRDEPALRDAAQPEVMFNYLGQFDQVVAGSKLFGFARESAGAWRSARATRRHLLEIVALVIDGRLTVRFGYAAGVLDAATIERVADGFGAALRGCVAHCLAPDAVGYTPSDFPLAGLDQDALDRLFGGVRDVEDVYPATPLQRLFLDAGSGAEDPGFQQYRFELEGPLDTEKLRAAWELVTSRHDVLRTRFVGEKIAPLAVVQRRVELPWRVVDWRGVPDAEARLASLLADDRARGLDMEIAPLMRVVLVRQADERWTMVWTQHHLLLDRWSWPMVLREVGACYDALRRGEMPALRPAVPFREYVAWLMTQPEDEARRYWTEDLADLGEPLRLLDARADGDAVAEREEIVVELTTEETTSLRAVARAAGLAPNVLVESAWAMALAHLGARDDVTFGLAIDGRGADLAGADEIVGVLVNNVPVRVRLDVDERVADWLAGLQRRQAAMRGAEHAPLEAIQRWIGLPWRHRLFETLLVFQDRAAEQGMSGWLGDSVAVRRAVTPTLTAYPITGLVGGDDRLTLTVVGDRRLVPRALVEELARAAEGALQGMTRGLDTTIGALRRRLPPARPFAWQTPRAVVERVAPRSGTERVLAKIWGELLGVSDLGVTDNFFTLGGHSLLATQIVSRVRETLQVDIPVRVLFQHPTVADLATALAAQERKPGHVERVAQLVLRIEGMSADELRRSAAERAARQTVTANGN
jgi:non-ribosomal peptide synthase protein (TIGR01720 family)